VLDEINIKIISTSNKRQNGIIKSYQGKTKVKCIFNKHLEKKNTGMKPKSSFEIAFQKMLQENKNKFIIKDN